jgi:hypothetical protein
VSEHDSVESPCKNVSLKFVGADGLDAGAIMPDDSGRFSWSPPAGKEFKIVPFGKKYGITTEPAGPFRAGQTVLIHLTR